MTCDYFFININKPGRRMMLSFVPAQPTRTNSDQRSRVNCHPCVTKRFKMTNAFLLVSKELQLRILVKSQCLRTLQKRTKQKVENCETSSLRLGLRP